MKITTLYTSISISKAELIEIVKHAVLTQTLGVDQDKVKITVDFYTYSEEDAAQVRIENLPEPVVEEAPTPQVSDAASDDNNDIGIPF